MLRVRFTNRYPEKRGPKPNDTTPNCRCNKCRRAFIPRDRNIQRCEHPQGGERFAVECPFCKEGGPLAITFGSAIEYYIERNRVAETNAVTYSPKRTR